VIVITNQSALGRGILLQTELEAVNRRLWNVLQEFGAHYDALYYCPHDPTVIPGCFCRKPRPGMLYQAALDLELDLKRCFMIGDKPTDVEAGNAAGCKTILIGQQRSGNCEPDFTVPDLFQSISIIVEHLSSSEH
jgi:D-glycero-D-manno-heptose 1,7-bisphosphate phosphatase